MTNAPTDGWSPADNPYAIAVSEARWWKESARLAILRMRRKDDARFGWCSTQQIDARQLVFALRQLLSAEDLEQFALKELGINQAVRDVLTNARQRFEDALPGIKDMRDGLMHFEEWARGLGRGPQEKQRDDGVLPRDVARHFWGFGFDPNAGTVKFGPYIINIDTAERAAHEFAHSIYMAAHEVDKRNTAELRAKTITALAAAGIPFGGPDAGFKVSPGTDLSIWVSLDRSPGVDDSEYSDLATRIVAALISVDLRLVSNIDAEDQAAAVRLARGEFLYVAADTVESEEPEESEADTAADPITSAQFQRIVTLAVEKFREAEHCAEIGAFEAACVLVGAAVESALIAQVCVFQTEVRNANLWRKHRKRKTSAEEDTPLFKWTLGDLIQVAVKMGWLPIDGATLSVAEPVEKLTGEVGDAVRFIQEVRNLVVHPGKYVRSEYWPPIGRVEYDVVYGVARAVLDHLNEAIERL
ncbi:hypothetical protein AB0E08_17940 [Streptomyces sp. NPDC048281]|uniref:hypothetical protein n=1 Tax=Streptomyces sp. NPDC048281 TaxID=3154715 RepID=UPI00342DBA01